MKTQDRVLIMDAAYEADVMADVVDRVFDAFPLDLAGKNVLVKPNILSGYAPEKAVTTHPALVSAVVEKLRGAGARVMVGTTPACTATAGRKRRPASPASCKQCGICVSHCPVNAMTMAEGEFPRANRAACIHCYCCQEMCPEHAIELTGRVMSFFRRRNIH